MRGLAPYALGALAAAGLWLHGFGAGQDRERLAGARAMEAARAEMRALAEDMNRAEAARLAAERERDALREQLDQEGDADPGAAGRALPADSLRRINSIR